MVGTIWVIYHFVELVMVIYHVGYTYMYYIKAIQVSYLIFG